MHYLLLSIHLTIYLTLILTRCIVLFFLVSQLFGERYRASYKKVIAFSQAGHSTYAGLCAEGRGNAQMPEEISEKPTDGAQMTAESPEDDIRGKEVEHEEIVRIRI